MLREGRRLGLGVGDLARLPPDGGSGGIVRLALRLGGGSG